MVAVNVIVEEDVTVGIPVDVLVLLGIIGNDVRVGTGELDAVREGVRVGDIEGVWLDFVSVGTGVFVLEGVPV